ncbi:hypothetical protein AB0F81_17765 [Actinoplanes sp. NPDC024001]|uniref:hypothetical protein n=1 Tax=Actinoplanes sp. NPDC024001 TaxID=3154598 RepID=UPI003404C0FE
MSTNPAIEVLDRWAESGGTWRVIARGETTVTVALLTCTGEEVDRAGWAADPVLLAYLSANAP